MDSEIIMMETPEPASLDYQISVQVLSDHWVIEKAKNLLICSVN